MNDTNISYRLGVALRDNTVTEFVRGCYARELAELTRVAPMLAGTMMGEQSVYALTRALYARTESLDAAAVRTGVKKFRALADAAQEAQVAWTSALQTHQRAQRKAA